MEVRKTSDPYWLDVFKTSPVVVIASLTWAKVFLVSSPTINTTKKNFAKSKIFMIPAVSKKCVFLVRVSLADRLTICRLAPSRLFAKIDRLFCLLAARVVRLVFRPIGPTLRSAFARSPFEGLRGIG
jgi:hypothetical protein